MWYPQIKSCNVCSFPRGWWIQTMSVFKASSMVLVSLQTKSEDQGVNMWGSASASGCWYQRIGSFWHRYVRIDICFRVLISKDWFFWASVCEDRHLLQGVDIGESDLLSEWTTVSKAWWLVLVSVSLHTESRSWYLGNHILLVPIILRFTLFLSNLLDFSRQSFMFFKQQIL